MGFFCAGIIWLASIDWLWNLFMLYLSRKDETDADLYAVERNHGKALRMGLIRNFAVNLDNIFCS